MMKEKSFCTNVKDITTETRGHGAEQEKNAHRSIKIINLRLLINENIPGISLCLRSSVVKKNLLRFVALIALAVFLVSCSVRNTRTEDYQIALPGSFSSDSADQTGPPEGKWWEGFKDVHLNVLVEEALRNNLDIAQAYERFIQSQAVFASAGASRGVQLGIQGEAGKVRQPVPFVSNNTTESYRLSAVASYEIDAWKKLSSRAEAARIDSLASRRDMKAVYMSVAASVADLYYLAVEQKEQKELAQRTIDSFRDTLEMVENRYRFGLVPALDVYQSRENLAAAEAQLPVFEANLTVTVNALSVLLGRFPDRTIGEHLPGIAENPGFGSGMPSQLLTRRPDIEASLLRLKASDERIAAAVADRFPSFNLISSYGGASDALKTVLDSPNIYWNLLLQAVQPLLDGGRRKAEVVRTEAVFRERLAVYHQTVIGAFREVEDAIARNREAELLIEKFGERTRAADSELRLALDHYLQGLSDYLPVLTAQRRYFESASGLVQAKRKLISAQISLVRALGGDWTEDEIDARIGGAGKKEDRS
jgi:NodT family efflux transporter outer membrane factor (OMF) lipoprotein